MWQREGAVRLFVEHVTLFNDQDDNINSESVVKLWKVVFCHVLVKSKGLKNENCTKQTLLNKFNL